MMMIKMKKAFRYWNLTDLIYANESKENEIVSDESNSVLYNKVNEN